MINLILCPLGFKRKKVSGRALEAEEREFLKALRGAKRDCHAQRDHHVKRQQEGSPLPAKKTVLRRNQPCQHLDLGLPASKTVGQ